MVVAIIGILAAIAIPNFINYQCKAKQSEAKSNLGTIRSMQEAYFAEFDKYGDTMAKIGFATKGKTNYSYTSTGGATFTATATGTVNSKTDTWTITNAGTLANSANACQ
ncbi:MAG: dolichyl-phosphate-mannose--protein mannosyltransferase [Desulfamplus sp.]|nr:dolichyl-phosphate-mannose--protein mannosyltransferase [Desulfamplus sp.]